MMRQAISTVADAINFLEGECALLAVQLEIVPPLWKVVSLDGGFGAEFSDAEIINFARDERAIRVKLGEELDRYSTADPVRLA